MTVCLTIIGLIGTFCESPALPVGACAYSSDVVHCVVQAEDLRMRASVYHPELGGTNCVAPCTEIGDGTLVEDAYYTYAACPPGMYGVTFTAQYAGVWQCRDSGGDVLPKFGRWYTGWGFVHEWVITIDFLVPADNVPQWAYMLLEWEQVE